MKTVRTSLFLDIEMSGMDGLTPSDFSIYSSSDTAHVGWYYIPVRKRKVDMDGTLRKRKH